MRRIAFRLALALLLPLFAALALLFGYVYYFATTVPREAAVGRNSIWCNQRYLPQLDAAAPVINPLHQTVAGRGYLYALLGAYVLQKDNREGQDHFFELPARIKPVPALYQNDRRSGFEASSYEIYDKETLATLNEVVVAFTGSNDDADWLTNFSLDRTQYQQAVAYVQKVAGAYPNLPLVVTGYSLGGALAVHVTKHPRTGALIRAAWVFNPSPKTWADSSINPKIWLAATSNDILRFARRPWFQMLPGIGAIGAPPNQRAENYYLIESNPVNAHFRWALARNILHSADLSLFRDAKGVLASSEPLEILQRSRFIACPKPRLPGTSPSTVVSAK